MVSQFSHASRLEDVRVPCAVPWVAYVERHDELLGTNTAEGFGRYGKHVVARVSHACLEYADMDYYGRGKDQCDVITGVSGSSSKKPGSGYLSTNADDSRTLASSEATSLRAAPYRRLPLAAACARPSLLRGV